jgi:hypothetical protein
MALAIPEVAKVNVKSSFSQRRQVIGSATLALRISRTAWQLPIDRQCPFAPQDDLLVLAFRAITLTTSMGTPFPSRSPWVGNPMFRHAETYRASCRCLTCHLDETSFVPILSARIGKPGYFFLGTERLWRKSVLPEDVCLHHRWLRREQSGPGHGTRNSRT